MPVGFILIHPACVFVFICSSVGVEMEANCVLCVWPYQHQKSEHSAAGGGWRRKRSGRISAVAMWPQHLSVQNRKEAIFQSYFFFFFFCLAARAPLLCGFGAAAAEATPGPRPVTLHLIFLKAFAAQYVTFDPD